ncbi:hypothetical protein Taro_011756 [Colocasia esculenta]|uniref:G-patch domain-containing protein n=1 Tax=Colocasia esculenta TaxID=4460 RepID=A0A843UAX2_COLES|nr:hypothetical protein [Colocasia esculenta]
MSVLEAPNVYPGPSKSPINAAVRRSKIITEKGWHIMRQMGYQSGKRLGAQLQGRTEAVKDCKMRPRAGLGYKPSRTKQQPGHPLTWSLWEHFKRGALQPGNEQTTTVTAKFARHPPSATYQIAGRHSPSKYIKRTETEPEWSFWFDIKQRSQAGETAATTKLRAGLVPSGTTLISTSLSGTTPTEISSPGIAPAPISPPGNTPNSVSLPGIAPIPASHPGNAPISVSILGIAPALIFIPGNTPTFISVPGIAPTSIVVPGIAPTLISVPGNAPVHSSSPGNAPVSSFSSGTNTFCKGSVNTTISGVDTMVQNKGRNVKKSPSQVDNSPEQVDTGSSQVDTRDLSQGIVLPVWDSVSTHLLGRSTHSGISVT